MGFDFRAELSKVTPKVAEGAKIYVFGAGEHWGKICKQYKYMVDVNLNDYIDGFIDNNPNKHGTIFHDKPVHSLADIDRGNSLILTSVAAYKDFCEIAKQLNEQGFIRFHSYFLTYWFTNIIMRYGYERFLKFKNKHKGQKCFIIGNGPSLLADDLEKIKDIPSFATNRIYHIYEQTSWRPSYYVLHDNIVLNEIHKEVRERVECPVFFACNDIINYDNFSLNNDYYYHLHLNEMMWKPEPYTKPSFSEDPFFMQWGATVSYDCIQLAVFMGFKEIYLIGMDNSFPLSVKNNGKIITEDMDWHFSSKYGRHILSNAPIDMINAGFKTAREYCDSHGINIYNATRGGKLEAFERVDFDSLFK